MPNKIPDKFKILTEKIEELYVELERELAEKRREFRYTLEKGG